mgnify:CR=1 FL=1
MANDAIEVRDLGELRELAQTVGFMSRNSIRSIAEIDRAIAHARSESDATRLGELRKSCERYGLLPESVPQQTRSHVDSPTTARDTHYHGLQTPRSTPRRFQDRSDRGRER